MLVAVWPLAVGLAMLSVDLLLDKCNLHNDVIEDNLVDHLTLSICFISGHLNQPLLEYSHHFVVVCIVSCVNQFNLSFRHCSQCYSLFVLCIFDHNILTSWSMLKQNILWLGDLSIARLYSYFNFFVTTLRSLVDRLTWIMTNLNKQYSKRSNVKVKPVQPAGHDSMCLVQCNVADIVGWKYNSMG